MLMQNLYLCGGWNRGEGGADGESVGSIGLALLLTTRVDILVKSDISIRFTNLIFRALNKHARISLA